MAHLDPESRYARQTVLPGIGAEGQRRLGSSHALLIGCGTLGCTIADQLTRAGVGRLSIVDRDIVEAGNLQRQSLFDRRQAQSAMPKAQAASERLSEINELVQVHPVISDLRPSNAESVLLENGAPDVLLDGTDNFETRYLLNDLAVKHAMPYVYGGVVGSVGMRAVFGTGGPCLRCVFPEPPPPGSQPTCETAGVLAPAAAIVASMQVAEAMKLLVDPDRVSHDLVEHDAWAGTHRTVDLSGSRDPVCPCCAGKQFAFLEGPDPETSRLCGRDTVQVCPAGDQRFDLQSLAGRLESSGTIHRSRFVLRAELRDPPGVTLSVFRDGRALIEGVQETDRARAIYARYIGI